MTFKGDLEELDELLDTLRTARKAYYNKAYEEGNSDYAYIISYHIKVINKFIEEVKEEQERQQRAQERALTTGGTERD